MKKKKEIKTITIIIIIITIFITIYFYYYFKVPDWQDWRIVISSSTPSGAADKVQGSQLVAECYSNRRTRTGFQQAGV